VSDSRLDPADVASGLISHLLTKQCHASSASIKDVLAEERKNPMHYLLTGGEVYAPDKTYISGAVLLDGATIQAVGSAETVSAPPDCNIIDVKGWRVIPGLIDVHLHGMRGQDVSGEGLDAVIRSLPEFGVTAFLPTTAFLMSADRLRDEMRRMAEVIAQPPAGAQVLGIHMEGPWVAADRSPFSHPSFCYPLTKDDLGRYQEACRGAVRMITFAPELGQAMGLIPWLVSQNIVPSIGHTNADYQTVRQAVALGLSHATHTYNAMQPLHHRNPGVLGAVFDCDEIVAQLIADGFHVHPAAMRLLLKAKGVERVCIVSDAVPTAGLPAGSSIDWEGFHILTDGETSRLPDGRPAGSAQLLNQMLKVLVQVAGVPFSEAVNMASRVPARVLGVNKGRLEAGCDADLVVMDADFCVRMTFVAGNPVFSN
jgi:N-acetylglucosamine-6-phosphate deacetylase